ncbi:guanine deaminase-like [Mizuhopecten yessoensis]|uniref:guanine deaminase-like n=1 Tax=Mizuhopecten yessoensis TaxID=6573 RepID=UPI000B45F1BF|nr:guanine deaminase-like [Mizuhopecten yessoensis]
MAVPVLNNWFAVTGTFIHSTLTSPMVILRNHCIGVTSGKIVFIEKNDDSIVDVLKKYDIDADSVLHLEGLQFVVPGFVDTHIHASQYSNCGKYLDEDMLSWLHKYTFPTEAKFADPNFATTKYWKVVYTHIKPSITPRFAGNCSMELMRRLGHIAKSHNLHVQTHIAETKDECEMVRKLFPEIRSYTDIYNEAGLLTQKTVLAHGIYLSSDERKLIRLRHSGISHCPNSNISMRSGMLDVRAYLDDNISVGLGTDISGGYNASMLNAMRAAVCTSNTIAMQKGPNYKPLDYQEVFKMATLEGAKVLDMEDVIGNFEIGKEFDALVVDPDVNGGPIDIFEDDTVEDAFQKFTFLGDDRNILKVFVAGSDILENLIRKEY